VSIENDAPDEPEPEPRAKGGWQQPGPGRPGPGEMAYRKAYELSLAKWGSAGKVGEKGIGSLRWVQQELHALGHSVQDRPPSLDTVSNWIKKGRELRNKELKWLLDPIHNREKIAAQIHDMVGTVLAEYEEGPGIREETEKMVALLGGTTGLLKLLAEVTGAKAATALEISHNMPAGMSEAHVRTLRATDPSALTDAERKDALAAYDTRRSNGSGGVDAASGHADPDNHGSVTP
jgi:hypothetical protein